MGFLDIPAEPVDGLEIETEPERANDAFQFTIIDNKFYYQYNSNENNTLGTYDLHFYYKKNNGHKLTIE